MFVKQLLCCNDGEKRMCKKPMTVENWCNNHFSVVTLLLMHAQPHVKKRTIDRSWRVKIDNGGRQEVFLPAKKANDMPPWAKCQQELCWSQRRHRRSSKRIFNTGHRQKSSKEDPVVAKAKQSHYSRQRWQSSINSLVCQTLITMNVFIPVGWIQCMATKLWFIRCCN